MMGWILFFAYLVPGFFIGGRAARAMIAYELEQWQQSEPDGGDYAFASIGGVVAMFIWPVMVVGYGFYRVWFRPAK